MYCVQTNTLGKQEYEHCDPPSYVLHNITSVLTFENSQNLFLCLKLS